MKTIKLTFKTIGIIFLILFCGIVVIPVLVNLSIFDETLNPEITTTIQPWKVPEDETNAYFYLTGFFAAENVQPHEVGLTLTERYRLNLERNSKKPITYAKMVRFIDGLLDNKGLDEPWRNTYTSLSCDSRFEIACLEKMDKQLSLYPVQDKRLQLLLKRYDEIMQKTRYVETTEQRAEIPLPPLGGLMKLSRLKLALAYHQNDRTEFLSQIKTNIDFWRMMFIDGKMLISKLIAISAIRNHLQILSEVIAKEELSHVEQIQVAEDLSLLMNEKWSIAEAFVSEHRMIASSIENSDWKVQLSQFFWQKNATQNNHYKYFTQVMLELSQLSSTEFYKQMQACKKQGADSTLACFGWDGESFKHFLNPYNMYGNWLIGAVMFDGDKYIARTHDLKGLLNLVKLQLEIKQYPQKTVEEVIKHSKYTNPYTEEPMLFNSESEEISFPCNQTKFQCKVRLTKRK